MTDADPRELLLNTPMRRAQVLIVAIMVALTALDGVDVLSISFAAPGIASEWGIERKALGAVLSMELIGMMLGSILIGRLADRGGRRRWLIVCVAIMTAGMLLAASAHGVYELSAYRVLTGLGIGGVLAVTTALATEFSSGPRRDLCVSLMAIGYPIGAVAGGAVIAALLRHHDWRAIFEFGGALTALFLPIVYWCVPESISWLCAKQPQGALEKVNRGLAQIGREPVAALPPKPEPATPRGKPLGIFSPALRSRTVLATLTYSLHITTFYFILKWVPKIVVDMGFAQSQAASVLVWANVGGAAGGVVLALLTQRLGVRTLTLILLVGSTAMVALFGHGQSDLAGLSLICAIAGFCTNGAVVGIYAILARVFPTEVRASGTGFAIGVGRCGSALAPNLAGQLFDAGYGLQAVSLIMGAGSLAAAVCLAAIDLKRPRAEGRTSGMDDAEQSP